MSLTDNHLNLRLLLVRFNARLDLSHPVLDLQNYGVLVLISLHCIHVQMYINTVLNWEVLGQHLKTIVYLTNSSEHHDLAKTARRHGWLVFEAPRVSRFGVPYLKEMFVHASEHLPGCVFYGYSNGDILYNEDLLVTLNAISRVRKK